MKKLFYFAFALLFSLVIFSCPDGAPKEKQGEEEEYTLDERLVGGKWFQVIYTTQKDESKLQLIYYFGGPYLRAYLYADGYYEFTNSGDSSFFSSNSSTLTKYIYTGSKLNSIDTAVYSKDGIIYWKHNDQKLMSYEFHDQFPYPDVPGEYVWGSSQRESYDMIAAMGGLITYRLYNQDGTLYDDGSPRYKENCYLLRSTDIDMIQH